MPVTYLKKAQKTPQSGTEETSRIVRAMLQKIEAGREQAAIQYGKDLDKYEGDIVLSKERIAAAADAVSEQLKADIQFSIDRVRKFAQAQRDSIQSFETELSPGLWAGQKLIPIDVAGCYVPGGRYSHVASAIMSIVTAKVAGVEHIVACTAPHDQSGASPAIVYAMSVCGADTILVLGGVQGIAAMAYGLFTGRAAKVLVGPGNRFVAEAKRQLFGQCGMDMVAGPTEIAVIADGSADAAIVAQDLVSQGEHGPDSPCWLISTSRQLAEDVLGRMDGLIADLPEPNRDAATVGWRDYGEVVVCDTRDEAATVSDQYAAEHLEVQTGENEWYAQRLRNYGSLFVGEETTVTYGDKCSGPNHILPTKGAAHYTGGLSVHKFIKVVTTQRMTREANREVGAAAARISRLEGMEAHARAGDVRLRKYFPGEDIKTSV
eukprot:scpid49545/ scgid13705/ Histidinol dehydrogenase 2